MNSLEDTIVALATPEGVGAIGVIRISGVRAFSVCDLIFKTPKLKKIISQKSHTVHFGMIVDKDRLIDEVLVTKFKSPRSYTGEDTIEISCHGSRYIQQEIISLLMKHGCRMADYGEFTLRAFLSGKLDLAQAEAVADLISSDNKSAHKIAIQQMRKGYAHQLKLLRDELLNFASLIELELDFSEEDVEFADQSSFYKLLTKVENTLESLIQSFSAGNVMKNGMPVVIVGNPNSGKSTLLNTLLNEDKAIVSHIAGTTRDAIEDRIVLDGVAYYFIDTAGIRASENEIEKIGIKKTFDKINQAEVVLYLFDVVEGFPKSDVERLKKYTLDKTLVFVANKIDVVSKQSIGKLLEEHEVIPISAKNNYQINLLLDKLKEIASSKLFGHDSMVSNIRHLEALKKSAKAIKKVKQGFDENLSIDLIVIDLKEVLHNIGIITGEITNEDVLKNVFSKFCIGK